VPIFIGIGASQIDRNSIADLALAKEEITTLSAEYVDSIKTAANTIADNGYDARVPPWPGAIYFEDVSANTNMEIMEIIIGAALSQGTLKDE
jgi:fumarate hydratase class II